MEIDLYAPDELLTYSTYENDDGEIEDIIYSCTNENGGSCALGCVTLAECEECNCSIEPASAESSGGPWGDFMDVVFCLLPIAFLIFVTLKSNPLPTRQSLPLAALLLFLIRLMYLGSDPILTCGSVILGIFEALTPLSIMAGAITLFETMEATYCLPYMIREMKSLTNGHKVAECMLIYSFAQMVEGASGFGTPAALGAPILVSTGTPALEAVVMLLLMNVFATVWGAVGTPIWFGFGALDLDEDAFLSVSRKAAVGMGVATFVLIPLVLCVVVPFSIVRQNIIFVMASLLVSAGPSMGIAFISYEFPSLIGGICGCFGTAFLITYKIGLQPWVVADVEQNEEIVFDDDHDQKQQPHENNNSSSIVVTNGTTGKNDDDGDDVQHSTENQNQTENGNDDDNIEVFVASQVTEKVEEDIADNSGAASPTTSATAATTTAMKEAATKTTNDDDDDQKQAEHIHIESILGPQKTLSDKGFLMECLLRTFPIWGVVVLLVLTRLQGVGLRPFLQKQSPAFEINFGTFGQFRISVSLVLMLNNILTYPSLNWRYETLFVPFIIPFVVVSIVTMILFRHTTKPGGFKQVVQKVWDRVSKASIALMGALALVQLMIRTGTTSPASIVGIVLSDWFGKAFVIVCPLLGVLGSFFSGSTTLSNLTFGNIQVIAAESIGVSTTSMLALQAIGAAAGNGVCLNNIISASAVVGLIGVGEGAIILKTYKIVFAVTTIATIVFLAAFFRF